MRVAREPEGRRCRHRGGGCRSGDAEREAAEGVVGGGAELWRVVPEAEPEAAPAGSLAILLRKCAGLLELDVHNPGRCDCAVVVLR
jgi:hypothetical protein